MFTRLLAAALILLSGVSSLSACGGYGPSINAMLVSDTVSAEDLAELREAGEPALARLFSYRERLNQQLQAAVASQTPWEGIAELQTRLARLERLIDAVGGARYCSVSRLYWHTDLAVAQARARETKRPILSLRMLGKLTDEFSCANSRFFRTTLYSNQEIAKYLRENYVLHWESVRPVPRITIDFGDGRKLERTITGNSAHHVLAADGHPLDVLPGLYGPQAFLDWLTRLQRFHAAYETLAQDDRAWFLKTYHENQLAFVRKAWQADLQRVAPELVQLSVSPISLKNLVVANDLKQLAVANKPQTAVAIAPPRAERAAVLAEGKGRIEIPMLVAMDRTQLVASTTDDVWTKIASLHGDSAKLDDAAKNVIRREQPNAVAAGSIARTKYIAEDPLVKLVRNLETSIALDAVRNEYLLHSQIHDWFAQGQAPADIARLNERVYAELFLTPSSDPWLGLVPADTYTALERGGLTVTSK